MSQQIQHPEQLVVIKQFNYVVIEIQMYHPKKKYWYGELQLELEKERPFFSTILIDCELFLVGGQNYDELTRFSIKSDALKTVKYYNVYTREWKELPPMNLGRHYPQLFNLKGHLCVVGGTDDKDETIEVYNFTTRKWQLSELPYTPSIRSQLIDCRDFDKGQITADTTKGFLYILDFCNGKLQTYDVSKDKWTLREIAKKELIGFGLAAFEGFLYIIGGCDMRLRKHFSDVGRYNVFNDSWCEVEPVPYACANFRTIVFGKKIIIADDLKVQEYNLDTNKWKAMCPLTIESDYRYHLGICNIDLKAMMSDTDFESDSDSESDSGSGSGSDSDY